MWLRIIDQYKEGDLIVIMGLSDLWFFPLKLHPYKNCIAFDSYDVVGQYSDNFLVKLISILNYQYGEYYIIRDLRFKDMLRERTSIRLKYIPDIPSLEILDQKKIKEKFLNTDVINFVSSGWITSNGDGGLLRSIKLIKKIWPKSVLNICFTKFMNKDDDLFKDIISYAENTDGVICHFNLDSNQYEKIIEMSHVGINLHDPIVFGEKYKIFNEDSIRKSSSKRVLDYAVKGCILMTTRQHRYSIMQFKKYSKHKKIIILNNNTNSNELIDIFNQIKYACD